MEGSVKLWLSPSALVIVSKETLLAFKKFKRKPKAQEQKCKEGKAQCVYLV